MSKNFSMEELINLTERWLVSGNLKEYMLGEDFKFISPFWRSNSRQDFIDKFQKTSIRHNVIALSSLRKRDHIMSIISMRIR